MRSSFWLALILVASDVWAGPFRMTGYDTASEGQAGPEMAYGHDIGVMFSNPALLPDVQPGFSVSFFFVQPFMSVELMPRPANADIPLTFYDSDVGVAGGEVDRPLPTVELPRARANNTVRGSYTYLGLGLVESFGIDDDFRFGLSVLVPTSGFTAISSFYPDEREQVFSNTIHMTRWGEWSQVLSLTVGSAYRIGWFSFGAAIEAGLNVGATFNMYIPEATVQDYAQVNAAFNATPTVRPVLGLAYRPNEWLSAGFTFRYLRFAEVDAEALLNLWNYHEAGNQTVPKRVKQNHLLALDYEPLELSLGFGVQFGAFFAQANTTWSQWSRYLDTHHSQAEDNATPEPGNPDDRFAFNNTFSVNVGLGYEYLEGYRATAGMSFQPAPTPDQVGRTNYADADMIGFALGHRLDIDLPRGRLRVDLALQVWDMLWTTVHKDPRLIKDEFPDTAKTLIGGQPMPEAQGLQTNNPGFPGYSFGGWSLAGSATLTYML